MKKILSSLIVLCTIGLFNSSCAAPQTTYATDTTVKKSVAYSDEITQSLFDAKDATISEENIQKILDGKLTLPSSLRIAIIGIESPRIQRNYWDDEDYLVSRQQYQDMLASGLKKNARVESVSIIPSVMLPSSPSLSAIREVAVRMRADMVLVYYTTGGIYRKYKLFSSTEFKAFATTQALFMDTRTGIVPFTDIVSSDAQIKKGDEDFNSNDAEKRTQVKAVLNSLEEVSLNIDLYLKSLEQLF